MKPHPRIRKTVKWGGAAISVLLCAVWVGTAWWSVLWIGGGLGLEAGAGAIIVIWPRAEVWVIDAPRESFGPYRLIWGPRSDFPLPPDAWHWLPDWDAEPMPGSFEGRVGRCWCALPLWMLMIVFAACSAGAFARDAAIARRVRQLRCVKCKYDLTGLAAAAVCPECGTKRSNT